MECLRKKGIEDDSKVVAPKNERRNLPFTEMRKAIGGELCFRGKEGRITGSIWNLLNLRHLSDFQVEMPS